MKINKIIDIVVELLEFYHYVNFTKSVNEIGFYLDNYTHAQWLILNHSQIETVTGTQTLYNIYVDTVTCGTGEYLYGGNGLGYANNFALSGAKYVDLEGTEHIISNERGTSVHSNYILMRPYTPISITIKQFVQSLTLTNKAYPSDAHSTKASAVASATIKR